MTSRHVAVDVLTGFLGSGKTTLLAHVLAHGLRGKPVAVVMNEIGEIGIDGRVVTGLTHVEKMVELSSGCICCSIDDYRFDLAIQEIIETVAPHLIVIESTGLADPEPVAYRVKSAGLRLDAIITVVDAANVDAALAETEVAGAQIAAADFLVINKIDLVAPEDVTRLHGRLSQLNSRALRLETVRGAIDADVLFATDVARHHELAPLRARSSHLAHDAFGSFVYRGRVPLAKAAFERVLHELPADVIRAKGIVRLTDHDWHCLFNVTCGRVEIGWVKLGDATSENQAVFVGRDLDRHRDAILAALGRAEQPNP
jgi:cobalamin biosynthesis protein CobW